VQVDAVLTVAEHVHPLVRIELVRHVLHAEPGFDDEALDVLASEFELVRWSERDPFFGTTNGTALRGSRPFAAGDPRREATGIVL